MPAVVELDLAYLDVLSPEFQTDPHGCIRARPTAGLAGLVTVRGWRCWATRRCSSACGTVASDRRPASRWRSRASPRGRWDRVITGILSLDGEDHTRLRRLVGQAFTPRSADRLAGTRCGASSTPTSSVAAEAGGQCDLVVDVCQAYPIWPVICELLGAPGCGRPQLLVTGPTNALQDLPAALRGRGRSAPSNGPSTSSTPTSRT